jgi:hypothetical protein
MSRAALLLAATWWWSGACAAPEPQPRNAFAAGGVPRVDAAEFRKLRGQWRGTEVGGRIEWTFSFGDEWAVIVSSADGEWYQGLAGIHYELGADREGVTRVPPGSGVLDVDVWTSRQAIHDGQISLGVYYFTQPGELKLCASAPGVHIRALSYDSSSSSVRCFRLNKVQDEPAASRLAPVEKPNAPVEREDRK